MEGFGIFLIIILFIFIIRLGRKMSSIDEKLDRLLRDNKALYKNIPKQVPPEKEVVQREKKEERKNFEKSYLVEEPTATKKEIVEQELPIKKKPIEEEISTQPVMSSIAKRSPEVVPPDFVPKSEPLKPPKPSFMERNPDLEKFIGENLLSKIGIVIFVIGMGFLVKLGIDNNVITEGMRVGIGVLIGGGMIALAHRLRVSFAKFSSILVGGALAVLYFTIALAFHEYSLIPQAAAFIIMVIITAFGVLLSIAYDRKELAVLAILGGFGTPFFLSTGSGNITVLFGYILILDIGMLMLVYFKKWNLINYLTYAFTYLLYIGVFATKYLGNEDETRGVLFLSLTGFYLVFFLMTIVYNVKNKKKFKVSEISMLLSNSAVYFGFGLTITQSYKGGLYSGLFTALVAIFNFIFAIALYKRNNIDKNLLFLLIGLVLTFVSLIAPIQLDGNYITLFWAVESVLLLWLSNKSKIQLMKLASLLILSLMLVSLALDWQQNYWPNGEYIVLNLFLNKVFLTSVVALIALAGITGLLKEDVMLEKFDIQFLWKSIYTKVLFVVVLYLSLLLELNYQFDRYGLAKSLHAILLGIYNFQFVITLTQIEKRKPNTLFYKANAALSLIAIASYMTSFLYQVTQARDLYLTRDSNVSTGFFPHYLLLALFIVILVQLVRSIYQRYTFKSREGKITLQVLSFIGVFICSAEIGHLSVIYQFSPAITTKVAYSVAIKSVYPVVWALSALLLMILGMKFRLKTLRISSLVLFSITILKLFLYDLAGNSTGKIVSFILLGAILLLISFLYQKLKFIIQDDDEKTS